MENGVTGLITLIAVLHVWFLTLEMFLWTKPIGLKTFNQSLEVAQASAVLAANQGLYNGFLVAGLVWSVLTRDPIQAFDLKFFFLGCVVVAGLFGGLTVNKKIFFVQMLPAAVAFVLLYLTRQTA